MTRRHPAARRIASVNDRCDPAHVTTIAIAFGIDLPRRTYTLWPARMVETWNACADAGRFDACTTIGDLALALLQHRTACLIATGRHAHEPAKGTQ